MLIDHCFLNMNLSKSRKNIYIEEIAMLDVTEFQVVKIEKKLSYRLI